MPGLMDEGIIPEEPVEEPTAQPEPAVEPADIDNPMVDPRETPPVDAPEKPDWLPENFWDAKDGIKTEALAKSYAELRNAFNKKNNDKTGESAEDYMLEEYFTEGGNFKAEGFVVPKDDPMLKAAYDAAKDAGMGVKQANEFIAQFMGKAAEFAPPQVDVQAEIQKLGKNAKHIISGIKTWIDGMHNDGSIDAEVQSKLIELGTTAAGIKALDLLRTRTGEQGLPSQEAITGTTHMTADDWYAARFETHAEAGESRAQYNERMRKVGERIFGNGVGTFNGSGLGMRRR